MSSLQSVLADNIGRPGGQLVRPGGLRMRRNLGIVRSGGL